jgi:hypothetical protein
MSTAEQLLGDLARAPEHHLEALSSRQTLQVFELELELLLLGGAVWFHLEHGHADPFEYSSASEPASACDDFAAFEAAWLKKISEEKPSEGEATAAGPTATPASTR